MLRLLRGDTERSSIVPALNLAAQPARRRAPPAAVVRTPSRYCRATDLPKLVGLWPAELADTSVAGREHLIAKLRRALRQERLRGLSGHWSYDLARHSQLLAAYSCEVEALKRSAAVAVAAGAQTHLLGKV